MDNQDGVVFLDEVALCLTTRLQPGCFKLDQNMILQDKTPRLKPLSSSYTCCQKYILHRVVFATNKKSPKILLVVTELINIAVGDFDTRTSACYSRVLVTELVASEIQCII